VIPAASARMSLLPIGDLAQLFDRFVEVAALGGVPHRSSVKSAVEQLILGAHASEHRMGVRCTRLAGFPAGHPAFIEPSRDQTLELVRADQTTSAPVRTSVTRTSSSPASSSRPGHQGPQDRRAEGPRSVRSATTEVIGNSYIPHSRAVLSTRRRGRGLPRRGSPGLNVREVSTGLHLPAG
jgi:hypothetical protein